MDNLSDLFLAIPVLFFSVVFHECAHGLVASWFGDPTARNEGRITLNPLPHIDLLGTIILPLVLILSRSPLVFGAAKPVPVDPSYFRHPRRDHTIVALAGPTANLLLMACFLVVAKVLRLVPIAQNPWGVGLLKLVIYGIHTNILLANFNLIPIPPLDGSWILLNLLPVRFAERFHKVRPFGFPILIVLWYLHILSVFFIPTAYLLRVVAHLL